MRATAIICALAAIGANGARILQSNDDGWAELYIRTLNEALNEAGHDVVLSAPAENNSGQGSSDEEPSPRDDACQYNSCSPDGAPVGTNSTNNRLNWVNSFPVTSARYGLDTFGPQIWNNQPAELVVSGPNVGTNLWVQVPFSGTVGIAVYAAHEAKVPSIAFSGASTGNLAWNTVPVPSRSSVYAALARNFTDAILAAGKPYLPDGVWLNVNFPKVEGACTDPANFRWVLSRINLDPFVEDVEHCGTKHLPTETEVILRGGCQISVSVGDATDKTTASADKQAIVRDKLSNRLTCIDD
ncbi:survival protein sure-likephosphatase/nucleotidase-like protein [Truncatella angustata]|uniref:Survival protein sure-likephosphatase/nucleotidase-like protein n=1 Tax=Truncatella angustata TaxID=152316 RepID=A0A9P8ZX81_9PEZI|nr:survival protein sure-likephosphatase/nucleotidase-like protein [Truncatella angustata]KAH6654542.1 survival protein sure-likephosphatase/nucleotidase-like protein [Truncatella angustata]KAH8204631.1 hypothetical protein TruAng_001260 [Truncatella angustata]